MKNKIQIDPRSFAKVAKVIVDEACNEKGVGFNHAEKINLIKTMYILNEFFTIEEFQEMSEDQKSLIINTINEIRK